MAYKATEIAKYIVSYCSKKHQPVSNLKLQKMLYYVWIEYYKKIRRFLFKDEFCAWQLGPVVPEVYYVFCAHAGVPISRTYDITLSSEDYPYINEIIDTYLPMSAGTLVSKSHRPGGPWDTIYRDGAGNRDVIPFSLIKSMECDTYVQ